jgi:hypothetical protein
MPPARTRKRSWTSNEASSRRIASRSVSLTYWNVSNFECSSPRPSAPTSRFLKRGVSCFHVAIARPKSDSSVEVGRQVALWHLIDDAGAVVTGEREHGHAIA